VESIEFSSDCGPVINVKGADLMDGTPIYDIKPYIRYSDSRPDAVCGYVDTLPQRRLEVLIPEDLSSVLNDAGISDSLKQTLALDPRPSYHDDPQREYGMAFSGYNVRFRVEGNMLMVIDVDVI
jgi:hypothetical protein